MKNKQGLTQDEKVLIYYDWLRGLRDNIKVKLEDESILSLGNSPKLSDNKSFRVIYYAQEFLRSIPDKFEKCHRCGKLFDSEKTGENVTEDMVNDCKEFKKCDLHCFYCETCMDRVFYYQDRRKDRFHSYYGSEEFIEKIKEVTAE